MKRDMELIRHLLMLIEDGPSPIYLDGANNCFEKGSKWYMPNDSGHSRRLVETHLRMMESAGLVLIEGYNAARSVKISGLTWDGYEYLDTIRDPEIWRNTRESMDKVGAFSLEVIKAIAKGLIKQKIKQHAGVEIEF